MDGEVINPAEVPQVLINCIHDGVLEVFHGYFGPLCPCGEDKVDDAGLEGFMSVISFVGTFPWILMLALPYSTTIAMVKRFTGLEISADSPDMVDGVGELINILAGAVSAKVEASGIKAKMSLPSVARGSLRMLLPSKAPRHRLHYTSAQGPFRVQVVTAPPLAVPMSASNLTSA